MAAAATKRISLLMSELYWALIGWFVSRGINTGL